MVDVTVIDSAEAKGNAAMEMPPISTQTIIDSFRGQDCPLYINSDGEVCYTLAHGESPRSVFVTSCPKSGTYLLDRLLSNLGVISTEFHYSPDGVDDFRQSIVRSRPDQYLKRRIKVGFPISAALIRPGQFGVGHIPCNPRTVAALREFSIIFTKREVRSILVSHMRMVKEPGRFGWLPQGWKQLADGPTRMAGYMRVVAPGQIELLQRMSGWPSRKGVCAVSFETLLGDHGEDARFRAVADLVHACGLQLGRQGILAAIENSIGKPTRTWTGERSSLERYWDKACEDRFVELGGPELNRRLGYE